MPELSLGELDSLVLKAFRGAGFSWGMAQEAGRAAAWLAGQGLPAATSFVELLTQIDGAADESLTPAVERGQWTNAATCCPVVSGTVLSDLGLSYFSDDLRSAIQLGRIYSPAILLPFLSGCAVTQGESLMVTMDDQTINVSSTGGTSCSADQNLHLLSHAVVVIANSSEQCIFIPLDARRAVLTEQELSVLDRLAHRTYVPATEQSRSSGAGAGLTDND